MSPSTRYTASPASPPPTPGRAPGPAPRRRRPDPPAAPRDHPAEPPQSTASATTGNQNRSQNTSLTRHYVVTARGTLVGAAGSNAASTATSSTARNSASTCSSVRHRRSHIMCSDTTPDRFSTRILACSCMLYLGPSQVSVVSVSLCLTCSGVTWLTSEGPASAAS